jgi:serine/threonine protein kinase
MLGQVLVDRYEIREQLGKKVGRQTWLAWDRQDKRTVVVKLLRFSQEFVWDDLKLFEREAETLKSLSHPQIPSYLDFCEVTLPDAQGFALVQSHVEGRSLEAHLQAGRRFSEADVKQLAEVLLNILVYLHSRNPAVIHRDIKPSNILLSDRSGNSIGQVHLVDFGSVQTLAAREGGTITIVGTYGYMPPEQFGGHTSPASDLYSLGATLIYLLTGQHPADMPQKRMRLQFEPLVSVSPEFKQWLSYLIEPDVDDRMSSAAQALQWLKQPPALIGRSGLIPKPTQCAVELTSLVEHLTIRIPQPDRYLASFAASLSNQRRAKQRLKQWLKRLAIVSAGWVIFSTLFGTPLGAMLALALGVPPLVLLLSFGMQPASGGKDLTGQIINKVSRKLGSAKSFFVLRLDRHQITWSIETNGTLQPLSSSPRETITRLEYHDRGTASSVKIWAGQRAYSLGGDGSLSPAELNWLGAELSHWLKLPIQHTQAHQLFSAEQLPDAQPPQAIAQVEKPEDSQIVLLKQPSWIEILIPQAIDPDEIPTYIRLYIDHQHLHMTLPNKHNPPPSLRQAITKLEHHSTDNAATVRIWASRRVYEIGRDGSLSEMESRWLAAELSDWLKLPIQSV